MSLFRDPPPVQYVDTGKGYIAYQVFGDGPVNLVYRTALDTHAIAMWESPVVARFFDRLSSFSRVLTFDWRGTGASDPVVGSMQRGPTVESYLDDLRFTMNAAGFADAFLVGDREGAPGTAVFAATYPERVNGLVLVNSFAKFMRTDDYPIGMPTEAIDRLAKWIHEHWGKDDYFVATAPSIEHDMPLRRFLSKLHHYASTPSAYESIYEFQTGLDIREILPSIQAPTLVIARQDGSYHRPEYGEYLAEHIPGAALKILPGADTAPFFAGDVEPVLNAIEEFVTGQTSRGSRTRTLATVLFTDVVESTATAAKVGDQAWLDTLAVLDRDFRDHVEAFQGIVIKNTGDGLLATFDGPARATQCASVMVDSGARLDVGIRAGLHTGEIEHLDDGDIGGIAVHLAARVMGTRPGAGVTVSSTVKNLVSGSGLAFEPLGEFDLKGIPDRWFLYELRTA